MIDDSEHEQGIFLRVIRKAQEDSKLSTLTRARLLSGLSAFAWEEYVAEQRGMIDK